LNEIFRRLPLLGRPGSFQPHALVLAIGQEDAAPDGALNLLHRAWREVPKQDGAESRFFVRSVDGETRWAAVEIQEVSSQFDYSTLESACRQGLVVFGPAWNEPNCFLYVEKGFAFPKAEEFATLYDDQYQSRRSDARQHHEGILLVSAGRRIGQIRTGPYGTLHSAQWLRVKLYSHSLAEDLYDLKLPNVVHLTDCDATAIEEGSRLKVQLNAGEYRNVVGAADEIERRIAVCAREMEDLLTRKARLATRRHLSWLPAYTFDQREAEPLPGKLAAFLRRPLGELAQYRYVALRVPNGRRHCIVGEIAMPWGAVMSVPSDYTWLCDGRWRDWGLPLFIRSDSALSIEIDEENVAGKVRKLLDEVKDLPLADANAAILTEPAGPEGGLLFHPLMPAQGLDQALHFFNDAMRCADRFAESIAPAGKLLVEKGDQLAAAMVLDLDETLQKRAALLLSELEAAWAATRERAMTALLQLRITDAALEIGEQACLDSSKDWEAFVNNTLTSDERISRLKLDAAKAWADQQAEREPRLEKIRTAQHDFNAELGESRSVLDVEHKRLETEHQRIESALLELKEARSKCSREASAVSESATRLRDMNNQAEAELNTARQKQKKLEEERDRLQGQRDDLKRCLEKTAELQKELDAIATEVNQSDAVRPEKIEHLRSVALQSLILADSRSPQKRTLFQMLFGRKRRYGK